jgi:DNA-binding SARP family transcriptional activator
VTISGRKVRALMADLLIHDGHSVSADRLVEDLWGDTAPADPTAALHVRVSQLRRSLAGAEPGGREVVASEPPGYKLRAGPDAVDAVRFTTLVQQALGVVARSESPAPGIVRALRPLRLRCLACR